MSLTLKNGKKRCLELRITISSKHCSIVLGIIKLSYFNQGVSKLSFPVMNEI